MTDNVVDFSSWKKKKQKNNSVDINDYEYVHEICTDTANELLNGLIEYHNIDTQKVEYAAEMIFFFEAYKALVMKCIDQWHPFQEIAEEFMREQGVMIEHYDDGYRFVIKNQSDENDPANDE